MIQMILFYIVFILSSIPMFLPGVRENIILLILHVSLTLISSLSLFIYRNRPYSLYKIIHLFFLFFICIAPILQYKNEISFWDGRIFTEIEYICTSFTLLCIIIFYNLFYYVIDNRSKNHVIKKIFKKTSSSFVSKRTLSTKEFCIFFCIGVVILLCVLYLNKFNLFYIFFRGGVSEEDSQLLENLEVNIPQSVSLIIVNFLKPMSVVLFLTTYKLKANKIQIAIMGILMLLIAFPTSMPRFSAAAMYIPVLLTFSKKLRKPNYFVFLFVLGLLVIFPFLNNFRYVTSNTTFEVGLNFDMFLESHFDSYSSFVYVLSDNILTFGNQLLGCIFFWLPRSIWSSKPIGSGAFIADEVNLNWTNISCCYFAEGYINYGFFGILLFTIFIAWFSASFDKIYWESKYSKRYNYFFELIYFLLLGLIFFMMRGDLLSSFAFTIGFVSSAISVYLMILFIRKYSIVF